MRYLTPLLAPLTGALLLAGVPGFNAAQAADSTNGINAALLYHNYCSVCHGDRGDGNSRAKHSLVPPPKDFTVGSMPRDYMIAVVAHGKPGTAMVGWNTQLNDNEIAAVVDFVVDTFMEGGANKTGSAKGLSGISAHGGRERDTTKPASAPSSGAPSEAAATSLSRVDMSVPFPNGLKGDFEKGKSFYMSNCATCHGATGDGKGPRAYFINPKPRNFLDEGPRRSYNRPALYAAVSMGSLGTEMPAWSKVLTAQEMADVAEFVFKAFIEPEPARAAKQQ